jgi:TetR/AcrR family transcriptional regulator, transcriptional repressor for nem operon
LIDQSTMQADTRDKLVQAARELFWEQGYTATGIAQILKKAGVNSGSLYHFFPTKEHLLLAVLEWYTNNLYSMVIDPVSTQVTDPIERVFGVLDGYRQQLILADFSRGCPIGNLSLELSDLYPKVREFLALNFRNWRDAIRKFLDDAAYRLPAETDTDALATFVLTTMEGSVMLCRATRHAEPYYAAVGQLRDYFDRLLADGTSWNRPLRCGEETTT